MNKEKFYQIKYLTAVLFLTLISGNFTFGQSQHGREFSKERPLWLDFDMETISEPKEFEVGYLYDWADGTLFRPFRNGMGLKKLFGKKEALNVNTLDEVPDSSWFTNRIGIKEMSPADVKRGPDMSDGPAAGELIVLKGKTIGVTPGFWIRDKMGTTYILKFDPPGNPEMASGAEIISSKLFYAIGYNVPENYLISFRRKDLRLTPKTTFTDENGKKRVMTETDLNLILSRVARKSDGSYRAVASKLIQGKPKGGFSFSGVRRDDPNDIIPHERRRDLRGLRIFSAWLEHNDVRAGNTLDIFVEEAGRSFIRHYLIDFGSTLGSDTVHPNEPEVGREYRVDLNEAGKVWLTAGIYQPKWRSEKYEPIFSPAVGRFGTRSFDPVRWKQNFPLAAFAEVTKRDAFWAAKIISRFTPEQIRAAVESAEFSNPEDTDYLTLQLIKRQRLIVEAFAHRRVGIGDFRLAKNKDEYYLRFKDFRNFKGIEQSEAEAENDKYLYQLKSAGKNGELIGKGEFIGESFRIATDFIRKIQASNLEESFELQGVAELILFRPNEKENVHLYLYAETPQLLKIAGIVQ